MPELVEDNPMILENVDTIARTVADLEASGYARDFLIVDTPGSFMSILREAIAAADVVVLPLQPSPFDFLAQEDAAALVKRLGKRDRTLFVVNRADARSDLVKQTLKAIAPLSPHKPVVIADRVDYAKAALTARAGVEVNRRAAAEIGTLWRAINNVMRKVEDEQVQREHGRARPQKVTARRSR
jgi:chromosome partitioning protein